MDHVQLCYSYSRSLLFTVPLLFFFLGRLKTFQLKVSMKRPSYREFKCVIRFKVTPVGLWESPGSCDSLFASKLPVA